MLIIRRLSVLTALFLASLVAHANLLDKPAVALELGGSPTILFTDKAVQAFGLGFGTQVSLAVSTRHDQDWGLKLRIDRYYSRQESITKANTNYVTPDSRLKSLSQQYLLIGAGIEKREKGAGAEYFWEALAGYAIGVQGSAEFVPESGAATVYSRNVPLESRLMIMGGVGARRPFQDKIFFLASARTFFLIGSPYKEEFTNRGIIPVPFMFNIGGEYQF